MIADIVKKKIVFTSLTQAKLAELIGTSPTQLGVFLKGEGASLPVTTLEKCFEALEINIDVYGRIIDSANKVATILRSRNYDTDTILRMSKQVMIEITNSPELKYLIDITDEKEFDCIKESGLIDIQSTYPYFKAMVVYLVSLGDNISARTSVSTKQTLWPQLLGVTAVSSMLLPGVAGIAASVISALGEGIFNAINKSGKKPLDALSELAKKIIKI